MQSSSEVTSEVGERALRVILRFLLEGSAPTIVLACALKQIFPPTWRSRLSRLPNLQAYEASNKYMSSSRDAPLMTVLARELFWY